MNFIMIITVFNYVFFTQLNTVYFHFILINMSNFIKIN
ncbi:hypothetical protein ABH962_003025 [Bacillus sp. RC54]